jgi:hypothetical protein
MKTRIKRTTAFEDLFSLTTTILDDLEMFGSENVEGYRLWLERAVIKHRKEKQ